MTDRLLIAVDSGTSVVKAVAFSVSGRLIDSVSRENRYLQGAGGVAEQDMDRTWDDAATVLAELVGRLPGRQIIAVSVTGQGDGTWLIDAQGRPVGPAWLWLDGRAGALVETLRDSGAALAVFVYTGTGLSACHQSSQLLWMQQHRPELLRRATTAMHCKDWVYFNLTGVRATDPSEGVLTYGDFRSREYRNEALEALGLQDQKRLLPGMIDGTRHADPLSAVAARRVGLPAGTPIVLGYIDVACTALGAGLYGSGRDAGASIVGSTGMHLRLVDDPEHVTPSPMMTGYCIPFPVPHHTMQVQSNMAATLNIEWVLDLVSQSIELVGLSDPRERNSVVHALNEAVARARPGAVLYHPFISAAGERGPFNDPYARASVFGIDQTVRLADLARGVYEGLGLAARDCHTAMGGVPPEVHLTGGAARSAPMRAILAACLDRPVRTVAQPEAGAAGAAMIAAVATGLYPDMAACTAKWITPLLGPLEYPDPYLVHVYNELFPIYREGCAAMRGIWRRLHAARKELNAA